MAKAKSGRRGSVALPLAAGLFYLRAASFARLHSGGGHSMIGTLDALTGVFPRLQKSLR